MCEDMTFQIHKMKGHIQRWVNEKHDVVTAVDMKEALESYTGVRGCRIEVAEVDVHKAARPEEWKGISALFNFEFLASGIRAWKAYGVGEGQMFQYDELGRSLHGPTVFISSCLLRLSPHRQSQGC